MTTIQDIPCNIFVWFLGEPIEPECTQDSECALNLACINTKCQDPCVSAGMCTSEQECKVLNTAPLRTMICLCPPNTITDVNGQCKQIGICQSYHKLHWKWYFVYCSLNILFYGCSAGWCAMSSGSRLRQSWDVSRWKMRRCLFDNSVRF